ncbi:MAG TPA: hypothetical protein VL359_12635, partial [bacterium]|nr:hypothetical protein [bacterium]
MAAGLLVLLVAGSAAAQNVSVSYLEGDARVGGGAAWRELSIGDRLPAEAVLRVGESSYVELATAGVAILLSQPGT